MPKRTLKRARELLGVLVISAWAGLGCEQRGERDLPSEADFPAVSREEPVALDSAAVLPDPLFMPAEPEAPARPGTAVPVTEPALAELSAALDVPVAGIARSELADTYTDARGERVHEAIDIHAPRGTPVLSAADGRLLRIFNSEPGGLMLYATDVTEQFILLYGHMDGYADGLVEGMPLVRGQVIGYVGTTGNAAPDAPHLHFGILRGDPSVSWWEGVAVNPYPLLTGRRPPR